MKVSHFLWQYSSVQRSSTSARLSTGSHQQWNALCLNGPEIMCYTMLWYHAQSWTQFIQPNAEFKPVQSTVSGGEFKLILKWKWGTRGNFVKLKSALQSHLNCCYIYSWMWWFTETKVQKTWCTNTYEAKCHHMDRSIHRSLPVRIVGGYSGSELVSSPT